MLCPNMNMIFQICEKLTDEILDPILGSDSATLILLSSYFFHRNCYKNRHKEKQQMAHQNWKLVILVLPLGNLSS